MKILVRINYEIILEEETTSFTDVNLQNQNPFLLTSVLVLKCSSLQNNQKCLNVISVIFLY